MHLDDVENVTIHVRRLDIAWWCWRRSSEVPDALNLCLDYMRYNILRILAPGNRRDSLLWF